MQSHGIVLFTLEIFQWHCKAQRLQPRALFHCTLVYTTLDSDETSLGNC